MILVSACLMGMNTKYDGRSNTCDIIAKYCSSGRFIPVCPEQLGGLSTPREPCEIRGGDGEDVLSGKASVITSSGSDKTHEFVKGTEEIIKLLKLYNISCAILKQRSPSCGSRNIYDGTFSGRTIEGQGIAAALLNRNGIPVYSEEDMTISLIEELIRKDRRDG